MENFIRGTDGHICFFPYIGSIKAFLVWMIREDWLKNVGMDVPVTTDDWYNVLKAFKEQDANGNGDPNDEIPFISRQGLNGATAFMEAWGVSQTGGELFLEKDGETVSYPYLSDRAREGLEFINKLYEEGLLDPEYASDGTDAWVEKTSNDRAGASWDTTARAFSASSMVQITTGKEDARYATEAFIQQSIPPLSYTEDEQERFNELSSEIQTYKDEKVNSFIMGKTPFDDWTKFTDTLKKMGVEELVEIQQAAYNRFIGK